MTNLQRQAIASAVNRLDAIYQKLPQMECKQLCQELTCNRPHLSRPEFDRIVVRWGYAPKSSADNVCPMLNHSKGTCRLYDIRPMVCRIRGLIVGMQCPHGCTPDRMLTPEQAQHLFDEVAAIEREYIEAVDGVGECDGTD